MISINEPELNTHIEGLLATISKLENMEMKQQRALTKAGKQAGEIISRGVQSEITDAWIVNHGHIGGEGNYDGPNKGFWGRGVDKSFPAAQQFYGSALSRIVGKIID